MYTKCDRFVSNSSSVDPVGGCVWNMKLFCIKIHLISLFDWQGNILSHFMWAYVFVWNLSYNVTYVSSFVMNSIMWYFVKCLLISFFYRTKFIYVYLWISKRFHSVVIMIHVYVVAVKIDDHSLCKQISVVKKTPHGLFYTWI